jgi:hypothetical protein
MVVQIQNYENNETNNYVFPSVRPGTIKEHIKDIFINDENISIIENNEETIVYDNNSGLSANENDLDYLIEYYFAKDKINKKLFKKISKSMKDNYDNIHIFPELEECIQLMILYHLEKKQTGIKNNNYNKVLKKLENCKNMLNSNERSYLRISECINIIQNHIEDNERFSIGLFEVETNLSILDHSILKLLIDYQYSKDKQVKDIINFSRAKLYGRGQNYCKVESIINDVNVYTDLFEFYKSLDLSEFSFLGF